MEMNDQRAFDADDHHPHHNNHILVLPFPSQGHINPMLQFSKRLLSKGGTGIKITLALTEFISTTTKSPKTGEIKIDTISDGYNEGDGIDIYSDPCTYLERFKTVGSKTLTELIEKHKSLGNPISCLVYNSFLPWALDVAKHLGLLGVSFFTQSFAVTSVYYYVQQGLLTTPVSEGSPVILIPGMPPLGFRDLPSFVAGIGSFHSIRLDLLVNQLSNIDKADWVLFNTCDKLETEVFDWMAKLWRVRTIGPTIPSMYLDKRLEADKDYGLHIFEPKTEACINWLNKKETSSVVYVSFGSISILKPEQMEEVAWALYDCNYSFLWVVRESEEAKVPKKFFEELLTPMMQEKGLVVTWCPQLEVLSHRSIGCFMTHCGWNSTLEALSLGVPMVGLPYWSDQATNAKCVEDVWKVGLRSKVEEDGISKKEEIQRCVKEVMDGEEGMVMKCNSSKWKKILTQAASEGGSSDENIEEFLANLCVPGKTMSQEVV